MALDNNIMNWDDTIENDGQEFVVLPEGDYTFTVTNFERGRFPGSAKIPPCNKATLTIGMALGKACMPLFMWTLQTLRNIGSA